MNGRIYEKIKEENLKTSESNLPLKTPTKGMGGYFFLLVRRNNSPTTY